MRGSRSINVQSARTVGANGIVNVNEPSYYKMTESRLNPNRQCNTKANQTYIINLVEEQDRLSEMDNSAKASST